MMLVIMLDSDYIWSISAQQDQRRTFCSDYRTSFEQMKENRTQGHDTKPI